jgi:hypothetical protein
VLKGRAVRADTYRVKPAISRSAAFAALAALALTACTSGGGRPSTAAQQGVEATTTSPTVAVKAARTMDELGKMLDLTVPEGYAVVPDNLDDTGPSDLDKAVSDDGGADARGVLTGDHFVRGYQREWSLDEDDQIISYVYQFGDPAGAADYTRRVTEDSTVPTESGDLGRFSVPGINGAVGVNGSDPNFASSTVTFAKGPYSVQVVVNGAKQAGLQSLASSMAEEQYDRL